MVVSRGELGKLQAISGDRKHVRLGFGLHCSRKLQRRGTLRSDPNVRVGKNNGTTKRQLTKPGRATVKMPIDYSKWDKLELSDDSDVEVHPNVDKKSFIRWKQRDIHEKRAQRKHDIQDLKLSNEVNYMLQSQIDQIVMKLKSGGPTIDEGNIANAFMVDAEKLGEAPVGSDGPSYQQMLQSLFDDIKKTVANEDDKKEAYIRELGIHRKKIGESIIKNQKELEKLEREEKSRITSEDLHEGFSSSHVVKPSTRPPPGTKKAKQKVQTVEVLNPVDPYQDQLKAVSSGAEADSEESEEPIIEDSMNPTDLGKKFGEIKVGDLKRSMDFIEDHPEIVADRNQDGLMVQAFNAQMEGKDSLAKQYVHQALLIQYVKQVGRSGVKTFFAGIADRNHKAYQVFNDDVNTTHGRIRIRTREILQEKGLGDSGGVEQIQLQAVDPNTAIHINVPPADSDDPEVQKARKIFESFPPGLQRALERGALEDINVVLGKMAVDEAEEIVEKLGEGGMLSIEPQIIDTTKGEMIPERLQPPVQSQVREEELD